MALQGPQGLTCPVLSLFHWGDLDWQLSFSLGLGTKWKLLGQIRTQPRGLWVCRYGSDLNRTNFILHIHIRENVGVKISPRHATFRSPVFRQQNAKAEVLRRKLVTALPVHFAVVLLILIVFGAESPSEVSQAFSSSLCSAGCCEAYLKSGVCVSIVCISIIYHFLKKISVAVRKCQDGLSESCLWIILHITLTHWVNIMVSFSWLEL